MTDELVEKVARTLAAVEYGDGHDEPWAGFVAHARAVIPLIYNAAIEDAAKWARNDVEAVLIRALKRH